MHDVQRHKRASKKQVKDSVVSGRLGEGATT